MNGDIESAQELAMKPEMIKWLKEELKLPGNKAPDRANEKTVRQL